MGPTYPASVPPVAGPDISHLFNLTPTYPTRPVVADIAAPEPEPERVEKRMEDMTLEDFRRGIAKMWRNAV